MPSVTIANVRGGRNGVDSPIDPLFPDNQCVEAKNVDFADSPMGDVRGGSDAFSTAGGAVFGNGIRFLCRHVPGGDETLAELWGIDGNGVVKRFVGGAFADVTLDDPITGSKSAVVGVSLNGKLFLFYESGVSRSHCYDPGLAAPRVRRVGLAVQALPTVANQGVGAYAATPRYYRTRTIQLNIAGTILIRRSEPSPASVVFTPSGAGLSARITRAALPGEGETHWEVEASTDALTWIILRGFGATGAGASIAAATTTYDDTVATTTYGTLQASDLLGTYTLFPSMKFATTDGNRLIGVGSYETATEFRQSRVWYSAVLGTDKGDDERWVSTLTQKNARDLSEANGGSATGITPTIDGKFWVGKYRQLWRFSPTGNVDNPYLVRQLSTRVGFLNHASIIAVEDSEGAPAIAFASYKGFYWLGADGFQYIGRDIEDVWRGLNGQSAVNLAASISVCHGDYHTDKSQAYWWLAVGAGSSPTVRVRLSVREMVKRDRYGVRGGWCLDDGDGAAAYCSCMFANTTGATVSRDLKPYIGRSDTTIYKCDTSATTDNTVAFRSYVKTKSIVPAGALDKLFSVGDPVVVAKAQSGSFLQVSVIGDFGKNTVPSKVDLSPVKSETLVTRKVGGGVSSDCGGIQIQYGDIQALASVWGISAIIVPLTQSGVK